MPTYITDLSELTIPADGDLFITTDVSDTTDTVATDRTPGTDKYITWANILAGISITESQISDHFSTLAELNTIVTDATLIVDGDSRLTDARTPSPHNQAASTITSGTFADARIASAATWNTAHGWGNHADPGYGYLTAITGESIGSLSDVAVGTLTLSDGDVLSWSATGSEWVSGQPVGGGGGGSGDMVLATVQTNTGAKTFNNTTLLLRNVANTFNGSFTNANTADRIYTLPNLAGTVALTSDLTSYLTSTSIDTVTKLNTIVSETLIVDGDSRLTDARTPTPHNQAASTITSGTLPPDRLGAASIDAITEIATNLKTGSDTKLVTGTNAANGNLAAWNADGDLVDGGTTATPTAHTHAATDITETADAKVMTGVERSKLAGIEASATEDQTAAQIKAAYEGEVNAFTDTQFTKLAGIETSATADQTGAQIKTAYEGESDTNAFTDVYKTKLAGIEASATEDQTAAQIETAYNTQVGIVSQVDAEAGTATVAERWTPQRVAQAIAALGGGSGDVASDTTPQLGGHLDINGHVIGDGTRELLTFIEDASAVNHINIENQATGGGPIISAVGDDAAIDLHLGAKGTGEVKVNSDLNLNGWDIVGTGAINITETINGRSIATDGAKLDAIEALATEDQSELEIETAYNNQVGIVSQVDAEAGTATVAERWTPQRVAQAIAALGGDALVANPLSQFAATTSLQLKGVISDETGSGALVFATSPTLVTPALGTPASGVLTNATGYTGDSALVTSGALSSGSIVPGFGTIDNGVATGTVSTGSIQVGHATDTTLARVSAGVISIDSDPIATIAAAQTLTNKSIVASQLTGTIAVARLPVATTTAAGAVELATAAETTTGTDTTRAVTPAGLKGTDYTKTVLSIPVTDPATGALTAGDGKAYYRVPAVINGYNLIDAAMAVTTASSSGIPTVQIHNQTGAVNMLREPNTPPGATVEGRLRLDATVTDSSNATMSIVIDTTGDDVTTGDMLRIDCDVPGTGTLGLMVELTFQLP